MSQSQKKVEENQFLLHPVEDKYAKYFQKVTELQAGDVIVRPNCKLCIHPLRAQAEQKWESTKGNQGIGNFKIVLKFLNDNSPDVKFTQHNLALHFYHHYEQQLKRMWLREYGEHLAEIMNYKVSKDEMFEVLLQANKLKLLEIAANPEINVTKQAEMMAKLTKAILDITMVQAKLRGELDTIDVYKEKFQKIIVNFIANEKDASRQQKLIEQLDLAREEIDHGG